MLADDQIQYMEQGVFFDFIYKSQLPEFMSERLAAGRILLGDAYYGPDYIAKYLRVFQGTHTRETLLPALQSRVDSLERRLTKLVN